MGNHRDLLKALNACHDAREWYDERDSEAAWHECHRGDWLLWIAAKLGVDRKRVVLAACDCAETALRYVSRGEDRPRIAIETARAWARDEAPIGDVRTAAYAAYAAAYAAYAAADYAYAAYAAADYAAAAADYAAAAAAAAYAAADYAAAAADYAAAAAVCADLVRKRIPWDVIESAIAAKAGGE